MKMNCSQRVGSFAHGLGITRGKTKRHHFFWHSKHILQKTDLEAAHHVRKSLKVLDLPVSTASKFTRYGSKEDPTIDFDAVLLLTLPHPCKGFFAANSGM